MEKPELKKVLETLLFITDRPVGLAELARLAETKDRSEVEEAIRELQADFAARDSALRIVEIAEGFQMATDPVYGVWVRKLYQDKTVFRLSTASLETLAIVGYRQPLTRAEIEEIRGVEVIAALETLLEKKLIKVVGRKETVGRPLLYGTTPEFLRLFGLRNLDELPALESFVPVPEPAAAAPADAPAAEEPVPIPVAAGIDEASAEAPPATSGESVFATAEASSEPSAGALEAAAAPEAAAVPEVSTEEASEEPSAEAPDENREAA